MSDEEPQSEDEQLTMAEFGREDVQIDKLVLRGNEKGGLKKSATPVKET